MAVPPSRTTALAYGWRQVGGLPHAGASLEVAARALALREYQRLTILGNLKQVKSSQVKKSQPRTNHSGIGHLLHELRIRNTNPLFHTKGFHNMAERGA